MLFIPWVDTYPAKGLYTLEGRVIKAVRAHLQHAIFMRHSYRYVRMEDRVIAQLLWRADYNGKFVWVRGSTLKYMCEGVPDLVQFDCIYPTAIKRLLKSGKIERKLVTRGWYRYYSYRVIL